MSKGGLDRWFKEDWKTPSGEKCGEGKDDAKCRPTKRVSEDTPVTWGEMSESQKKRAIKDKNKAKKQGKQYGDLRFKKIKGKVKAKKD